MITLKNISLKVTVLNVVISNRNKLINADINGELNILNKSKVVDLSALYHKGKVDTPVRIKECLIKLISKKSI